jgi:hypothetical protein
MGLLTGGNVVFLRAKNGAISHWNREEKKEEIAYGVEGKLVSIFRKEDEFEGRKIAKLVVKLVDPADAQVYQLEWTEESWFTQGFFARILKVNLNEPLTIGANGSDKNEKVTFCWMKQNGKTIEKDVDFPRPITVEKRGKVSYDYDDMLEKVDVIVIDLQKKFEPVGENAAVAKNDEDNPKGKKSAVKVEQEENDSIPF